MKIAIRGYESRGKEVIQILNSLGGKTTFTVYGFDEHYCYYINPNGIIIESLITIETKDKFSLYTLEEFERKFPFKIGETVITTLNHVGTIIGVVNNKYEVMFKEDSALIDPCRLKLYKEMKEKRNITLTLEKAKEWYKKGGELKEIALQAFSEEELNSLPRSWEEYCRKYESCCFSTRYTNIPLKYDALIKLEQLRDCWRQGWEPNWLEGNVQKYVIQKWRDRISIETTYVTHSFLSFPTYEMAKEFLECFKDLIEKAIDLI